MRHRCCIELDSAEMTAVLAAAKRDGELSVAWMKRVILERANSFNVTFGSSVEPVRGTTPRTA